MKYLKVVLLLLMLTQITSTYADQASFQMCQHLPYASASFHWHNGIP